MSVMPLLNGFVIGGAMIIPIGAQNSFILNQGIKQNHHFYAASICVLCDIFLMSAGIFGGGALLSSNETLLMLFTWAGILFLSVYGAMFFKSFIYHKQQSNNKSIKVSSLKMVIITALAVTLLNPHAYLDTIVIMGSISSQFPDSQKIAFLIGTILASFVWFYSLAFASAKFSFWLSKDNVQRGINLVVALIMWSIALSLIIS